MKNIHNLDNITNLLFAFGYDVTTQWNISNAVINEMTQKCAKPVMSAMSVMVARLSKKIAVFSESYKQFEDDSDDDVFEKWVQGNNNKF